MNEIDTNIENYTISELMAISEISDLNHNEIINKTNKYINSFKKNKPQVSSFFLEIQKKLIKSLDQNKNNVEGFENMNNNNNNGLSQAEKWLNTQYSEQENKIQLNKITERENKVELFDNINVPMKREQLGVNDVFQVPIKQDSLNPNLKNTINRTVNLDSQFRQYASGIDSISTNYTVDLSDTLKDVLNLRLYSFQIPFTWYVIDKAYGNNCLWITDNSYNIAVSLTPGNYNPSTFITELVEQFINSGFTNTTSNNFSYKSNNGKLTLFLNGLVYYSNGIAVFTITNTSIITFFDFNGFLQCSTNCISKSNHFFIS